MDYENLNQKLGGCGIYQYILFFLLSLTTFKYAGDLQSITFAVHEPKFNCSVNNKSGPVFFSEDQCKYRFFSNSSWIPCSKWTYDMSGLQTNLVMQFDMICGQSYYRHLMFSVFFFGCLCALPVVMLGDTVGRKSMLVAAIYLSAVTTVCLMLARSIWQVITLTFLLGLFKPISINLAFTTLIELLPNYKLDHAGSNFWTPFSIGFMLASPFAYMGRSWRYVSIFSLSLTVFYVLYFCFVPETPRWLMLNKKGKRAHKVMLFIARINRRSVHQSDFEKWKPIEQKTGRFWNLFKYKTMIYRILILNFSAWSFSFAYIGASTDLTFASENIFITSFFMGLIEFPTGPLGGILANKLGRKKAVGGLTLSGVVCLIIMPFIESDLTKSSWQPWLKLILAMGAKLGFLTSWLIFDIIVNEIMPTTMRNSAMAIVYLPDGLSSIVAPTVHSIAFKWYHAAPCLIYSVLLTITVFLILFFIPESRHLPVPQTIEQSIALVIHKEKEWKEQMRIQAETLGMSELDAEDPKV